MKSIFQKVFQVVGTVGQIFNQFGGYVPAKYQGPVAIGIGIAQGVVGVIGHYYTPDGQKITPVPPPPQVN